MMLETPQAWASAQVQALPSKWARRLMGRWERAQRGTDDPIEAGRLANIELRETVASLGRVRIPLDATDSHITERAKELADLCMSRAQIFHDIEALAAAMCRVALANDARIPEGKHITPAGIVARLTCPLWWRRQLRKAHAKNVEGAAITLGLVNKARQCYVSDESLKRRQQQNKRNAETLENTTATNELGQEYTLAELAATGPANKAIRRAELMTRISGFERIAQDMGHSGMFFTMTCPSYMHKWRTVSGGGVVENPRYAGTTPREAQAYLGKVWARIRAALARRGVGVYGFRIAEPNHDGTPHWHLLVFHAPQHLDTLRAVVYAQAMKEAPNEPGAALHRVDFKPIEAGKGTAAGYIAKYVAKNIDGYSLDSDLYGNPAMETSARVEAWATTWGIRQFQQVGGPPVGVWRELRRVEALPDNAPEHLAQAWRAVNKLQVIEGRDKASVAWDRYTQAQGGVFCGRKYRIRMATKTSDKTGRYGDPIGEQPIGVTTTTTELYTPAHMAHMNGKASRRVEWFCESARHEWVIGKKARFIAPWTCVNNCTEGSKNDRRNDATPACGDQKPMGQGPDHSPNHGGAIRRTDFEPFRNHGSGSQHEPHP